MGQGRGGGEKKHFDSADWAKSLPKAEAPAAAPAAEAEGRADQPKAPSGVVTDGQTMLPPPPSSKS